MTPDDAIGQILGSLHAELEEIPEMIQALRTHEVREESANGSVAVVYGSLGDLKRVEITADFLHSAGCQRVEQALLDAFGKAERAADAARAEAGRHLTFMGIPIGQVLGDGARIADLIPRPEHIAEIFGRGRTEGQ